MSTSSWDRFRPTKNLFANLTVHFRKCLCGRVYICRLSWSSPGGYCAGSSVSGPSGDDLGVCRAAASAIMRSWRDNGLCSIGAAVGTSFDSAAPGCPRCTCSSGRDGGVLMDAAGEGSCWISIGAPQGCGGPYVGCGMAKSTSAPQATGDALDWPASGGCPAGWPMRRNCAVYCCPCMRLERDGSGATGRDGSPARGGNGAIGMSEKLTICE